jgi:hypothetical protein
MVHVLANHRKHKNMDEIILYLLKFYTANLRMVFKLSIAKNLIAL